MLNIKKNLVGKSANTRELELLERVLPVVESVRQFTALHKLKSALEKDGRFSLYFSDRFKFIGKLDLVIWQNGERLVEVRCETRDKTIPAILDGLGERQHKLREWQRTENEVTIYLGRIERILEDDLAREMTQTQFDETKKQYAAALREMADELDATI